MSTSEELKKVLEDLAKEHWEGSGHPILLSNLPPLLANVLPGYKDALAGKSLKVFIKEAEGEGKFRLVEHPTQRAKLGFVPGDIHYEFPALPPIVEQANSSDSASEKALLDFLRALKKLPANDLAKVEIPVSVLVKMIK